jgi:hypothetical protein
VTKREITVERKITGGCLCGAVTYEGTAEPAFIAFCHCTDCQKASGGPYSANVAMPADTIKFEGRLGQHRGNGENPLVRNFCPSCGSQMFFEGGSVTGLKLVQAGTLEDSSWVQPQLHIFCDSAQPWDLLPKDATCLPQGPPVPA